MDSFRYLADRCLRGFPLLLPVELQAIVYLSETAATLVATKENHVSRFNHVCSSSTGFDGFW